MGSYKNTFKTIRFKIFTYLFNVKLIDMSLSKLFLKKKGFIVQTIATTITKILFIELYIYKV